MGPRLEHSPSVQAGKINTGETAIVGGEKKKAFINTFMSCFFSRFWIPAPEAYTRLPPVSLCHFNFIKPCAFLSWKLWGQWYWQHSALAIQGHPQCRTATCLWAVGLWDRQAEYRILHARVGAASQRFRERQRWTMFSEELQNTARTGWTQAGFAPWP